MKEADGTSLESSAGVLYPLGDFYAANGAPAPDVQAVPAEQLPDPYRRLLAHERDMTSTLEAFHGQKMSLRVLGKRENGSQLLREVLLVDDDDECIAEFGAICIELARFDEPARAMIVECRRPLGAILDTCRIDYVSEPTGFFRVRGDDVIRKALGKAGAGWLFGRHNRLLNPAGEVLAEVVEILPAMSDQS